MYKTQLVRKWKPGDRSGNLFYISCHYGDYDLSKFCTSAKLANIIRTFVQRVPAEDRAKLEISVGIELYAKNGGHRRIVIGRLNASHISLIGSFVKTCKESAAPYNIVYPPFELVETEIDSLDKTTD